MTGESEAKADYAESNVSFLHSARAIHLTDHHLKALHDSDVRCLNLVFAVDDQPGQLDVVGPRGATIRVPAAFKQLACESLTVKVAAMTQRVETPDALVQQIESCGHPCAML